MVDCIEQVKPLNWSIVSLEHDNMAPVRRCLALLMRSLFNRTSIRFMQSIYIAFRDHKVLTDHHLAPFITKPRVELLQQWCATEQVPQDDEATEAIGDER